jgi:hypothetical protein
LKEHREFNYIVIYLFFFKFAGMSVQIVTNSKGEKTSVLVSYKEWNALNKEREESKHKLQEAELLLRYKQAFNDAKLLEQGRLETHPIAELLDEL